VASFSEEIIICWKGVLQLRTYIFSDVFFWILYTSLGLDITADTYILLQKLWSNG
jgi:hypothetical protein